MIGGYRLSGLIALAAKLRVADHLATGPKTAGELALLTSCGEDSLYRALRALASWGIFAEEPGRCFRLTPKAEYLRSDAADSLRVAAEVVGEEWAWRPWGSLLHTVRTGTPAFDYLFGESTWRWFGDNPAAAGLFNQHMEGITSKDSEAILAAYDFPGMRTVVDVGGGQGTLLAAILRRHPNATGVLVNLPQVIRSADRERFNDVAHRFEWVAGNFFDAVPAGCDVYVLKDILHDWADEQARSILATCRRAMREDSILLVIEHLVCPPNRHCVAKIVDIQMMVRTGGRNRTQEEFRELFEWSGFGGFEIIRSAGGPELLAVHCRNDGASQ